MALTIAAAAAGVFGGGSLSSVEVSAGDVLMARYPRFARADAPLELQIEWAPQRNTTLWIGRDYLDQFEIEELRPAPAATTFDRERIYYTFRATEPDQRVEVAFRLRPQHAGRLVGSLGVDEASLELRQLIFP